MKKLINIILLIFFIMLFLSQIYYPVSGDFPNYYNNEPLRTTPKIKWELKLCEDDLYATLAGDYIVVASEHGKLFVIEWKKGKIIWELEKICDFPGYPVISDNIIYLCNLLNDIYAVELLSGKILWKSTKKPSRFEDEPTIIGDYVYVFGDSKSSITMINKKNGEIVNYIYLGDYWVITINVINNFIYLVLCSKNYEYKMLIIDPKDLSIIKDNIKFEDMSCLYYINNLIIYKNGFKRSDGKYYMNFYILDENFNSKEIYSTSDGSLTNIFDSFTTDGKYIYQTSYQHVYCISIEEKKLIWNKYLNDIDPSPVAICKDIGYFSDDGGDNLYGIELNKGEILWSIKLGSRFYGLDSIPIPLDNAIIVYTTAGRIALLK